VKVVHGCVLEFPRVERIDEIVVRVFDEDFGCVARTAVSQRNCRREQRLSLIGTSQ
jgi:hypothetical protein